MTGVDPHQKPLFGRWVGASSLGWLLGLVLGIGGAVLAETIGLPTNQSVLGFGMGAGIGIMQGRVVGPMVGGLRPWLSRTVAGMGAPFLVWDLSAPWVDVMSLPLCLVVGGVLTGALQARILGEHLPRPHRWVVASALGWATLGGIVALLDAANIPGPLRPLPLLVVMICGGAVLGAITGRVLAPRTAGGTPTAG